MTVVRKSDSHQGGVKCIRKVCQLMERYFSLQAFTRKIGNKKTTKNSYQFIETNGESDVFKFYDLIPLKLMFELSIYAIVIAKCVIKDSYHNIAFISIMLTSHYIILRC